MLSDRQKGLIAAAAKVMPLLHHGHCGVHMAANIKSRFGDAVKARFLRLLYAENAKTFDCILIELKEFNNDAAQYIANTDYSQWTAHAFPYPRWGFISSNTAEQCNAWIGPLRIKPITFLLQGIWDIMMEKCAERRRNAHTHAGDFVPAITNILKAAQKDAFDTQL